MHLDTEQILTAPLYILFNEEELVSGDQELLTEGLDYTGTKGISTIRIYSHLYVVNIALSVYYRMH